MLARLIGGPKDGKLCELPFPMTALSVPVYDTIRACYKIEDGYWNRNAEELSNEVNFYFVEETH